MCDKLSRMKIKRRLITRDNYSSYSDYLKNREADEYYNNAVFILYGDENYNNEIKNKYEVGFNSSDPFEYNNITLENIEKALYNIHMSLFIKNKKNPECELLLKDVKMFFHKGKITNKGITRSYKTICANQKDKAYIQMTCKCSKNANWK